MPSILIVEDHDVMAQTMAEYLRWKLDAEVRILQSAEAVRREIPELNVDVVLVDVSLPDRDGLDLVAELQEHFPDLPCLVVSGYVEPKYIRRALAAGARGYIEKGNPDTLAEAVKGLLAGEIYVSEQLSD